MTGHVHNRPLYNDLGKEPQDDQGSAVRNAARLAEERILELYRRMTAEQQLGELDRWEELYG